ncbi:MAG: hypothetical protein WA957_12370 [Alteraurantiacibacter sp.]
MSQDVEPYPVENTPLRPKAGSVAWCGLMACVILASIAILGIFLERQLHPEGTPVVRLELKDLTPQPGFDL